MHSPRKILFMVMAVLITWFIGICLDVDARAQSKASGKGAQQKQAASKPKQKDEYHRPEPSTPIKPTIPGTNRYQHDKVFLEQADSMIKVPDSFRDHQIVKGNVKFRQMNTWMYCDSAYYFPEENSLDAFGHVKMVQGDTLTVYADKLYYDGTSRFARLRCGPTESTVRMINRKTKLTTDSLDYSLAREIGWYATGGKLEDESNILTSIYGQYSPATKDAEFFNDVELKGKQNDFELYSDTLYYNTASKIARIVSPTRIFTTEDEILTSSGFYNTGSGVAELTDRSTIYHTDSLMRTTTLEGDSIVYDPETRISRAYQFRDRLRRGHPVVITDTARKAVLIGGFAIYNDLSREAMATEYPLLMEYSRGDTLFLRADTILTRMIPYPPAPIIAPDSLTSEIENREIPPQPETRQENADSTWHYAKAWPRARFFRKDIQGVSDTIIFTEIDSILRMRRLPIVWNQQRQVRGDTIIIHLNDSTVDWALIPSHARIMEHIEDDFYNQLHSDKMTMWFNDSTLRRLEGEGSVETIMLPQEKDSTYNRLVAAESSYLIIEMDDKGDIEFLKMWPEVTGSVTPLFLVKKNQKLLPGAVWYEQLRPKIEWYEGRLRWDDDLGELPLELEDYFNSK